MRCLVKIAILRYYPADKISVKADQFSEKRALYLTTNT